MSDHSTLVGLDGARDDVGFKYELLDNDEARIGWLDGVNGGSLDYNAHSRIRAGGSIDITGAEVIDWHSTRIRPWAFVDDHEWPLGIFIPAAPADAWNDGRWSGAIELLGKLTVLETDEIPAAVSYPAGTVVTTAVREQIIAAGQTADAITDSTATLSSAMTWDAGTSRLTIINQLLTTINYWALGADGYGRFTADPYVRPAARPTRYPLLDGANSIYVDEFTRDRDLYKIPNRVLMIGTGSADTEALVGVAENTDPTSQTSIPYRGFVKTETNTGIDAVDLATAHELARRRLINASSVTASIPLTHAMIPLDLNDVVQLRRVPAGIDARHTVEGMSIDLGGDGLELMESTLREVRDL